MHGALVQVAQAVGSESHVLLGVFTRGLFKIVENEHAILQRIVFHCTLPGPDAVTGLLVGHAYGRMGTGTPTTVPREKSRVCRVPELLHNADAHNWSSWEGAGPTGGPALDAASWA